MVQRDAHMVAEDDPQFMRFWGAYGKRTGKKDARIAWAKLNPSPELVERMITALGWQFKRHDWTKENCTYAPMPATYLRGERWTDERPGSKPMEQIGSAVRCWYGHQPPCVSSSECRDRFFREARAARQG